MEAAELSKLSKEDLINLIEVASVAANKKQASTGYTPNPTQLAFHSAPHFIRFLACANGVGKSTACLIEAIWTATGTHPHRPVGRIPNTTYIVLDDAYKSDNVYWEELQKNKWYDPEKIQRLQKGRPYTVEWEFPNGSRIIFRSHDIGMEKWESVECTGVIFDEPFPNAIFNALIRGMRTKGTKPWIAIAGTPRGKYAPWMYRLLWQPWKTGVDKDIICFTANTFVNAYNLEEGTIDRWKKYYSKEELEVRLYGKFEFLSGVIFKEFSGDHHIVDPFDWPFSWPCVLAIDPHLRKNHVAVLLGRNSEGEVYVIKEMETSLAGEAAAEFFINSCRGYKVAAAICDNFGSINLYEGGNGATKRRSFIDIFNKVAQRLRFKVSLRPTTNAQKSDDEWIEDMHDYLRLKHLSDNPPIVRARFMVFRNCLNVINDFETYIWDEWGGSKAGEDQKEEPLGDKCDYLMCVKYGISVKPDKIGTSRVLHRNRTVRSKEELGEMESDGNYKKWMKD